MKIRGTVASTPKRVAAARTKASKKNPTAVVNLAGGLAFRPVDAAQRLINRIGVPNFNEPTYYGGSGDAVIKDRSSLSDVAQAIIKDAEELAQSSEPQLLLSLAWWSRTDAKVRTTPVVLLAVAAHYPKTRKYLRKYIGKILTRADQIKDFWAIYDLLYCRDGRDFNITLKRAVTDVFGNFSEVELLKYDNAEFPTFGDILKMTNYGVQIVRKNGKKRRIEKVKKAVKDYLVYGTVTDEKATPVIAARVAFNKSEAFDERARGLAQASHVNWEVIVSKFGNTKEVWEFLIDTKQLGYMAMIRNLRNILNAKVSAAHIEKVATFLVSGAVNSKQMPTAFYSATLAVEDGFTFGRTGTSGGTVKEYNPDRVSKARILKALEDAVNAVRASLPKSGGTTAIFVDNSGSMGSAYTHDSPASKAGMLAVMAAAASDDVIICAFGTDVGPVKFRQGENAMTLKEKIRSANTKGMATNGFRCVQWLAENKIVADRIILLTDCELYNSRGSYGCDHQLAPALQDYREKFNKDCWLYCINVVGSAQGSTPVDSTTRNVACLSGHSEKMLEIAMISENGGTVIDRATGKKIEVDSMSILDLIRTQFTLVKQTSN